MKVRFWVKFILMVTAICMNGCDKQPAEAQQNQDKEKTEMSIRKESFGQTADGKQIDLYTLTNSNGLRARIMNYGATLLSLEVPDKNGNLADITLGFDKLDGYLTSHPYFGATVGRYGNRIGGAKFVINGVEYKLAANDGKNHLHGGIKGFYKIDPDEEHAATLDHIVGAVGG